MDKLDDCLAIGLLNQPLQIIGQPQKEREGCGREVTDFEYGVVDVMSRQKTKSNWQYELNFRSFQMSNYKHGLYIGVDLLCRRDRF